jgi:hypothetical protein
MRKAVIFHERIGMNALSSRGRVVSSSLLPVSHTPVIKDEAWNDITSQSVTAGARRAPLSMMQGMPAPFRMAPPRLPRTSLASRLLSL